MEPDHIQKMFEQLGGTFFTPASKLSKKLENIHAILLEWDGVFNSGKKGVDFPSSYSETDSLGINLMRFGIWMKTGKLPFIGIITGQINESAFQLAKREHFDSVYFTFKSTKEALTHVTEIQGIRTSQMAFVMDDVLDISAAEIAGLTFLVKRKASPLFENYILRHDLADYITANAGDKNAIREICELIMGLNGTYDISVEERIAFSEKYQDYLEARDKIESRFYHKVDRKIIETII